MERPDHRTIRFAAKIRSMKVKYAVLIRILGNTYFSKKSYFSTVKYGKYGSKTQYDVFNTNTVLIRIRINTAGPALHICVVMFSYFVVARTLIGSPRKIFVFNIK